MTRIASKGPILTLVAAAALGIGVFTANVTDDGPSAAPQRPAAGVGSSTVEPSPPLTPSAPIAPAPAPFPARAAFHADIPTRTGTLTVDIKVNAATATAYACDSLGVEKWLSGTAVDGVVSMKSSDGTSRLDGRHQGNGTVVGDLSISTAHWAYTAIQVEDGSNA